MLVFQFKDSDAALRYWQVVCELHIDGVKEREEVLLDFAKNGEMAYVMHTERTKEELVRDWSRHSHIMDITAKKGEEE